MPSMAPVSLHCGDSQFEAVECTIHKAESAAPMHVQMHEQLHEWVLLCVLLCVTLCAVPLVGVTVRDK